jgi:hypothetical protein
MLTPLVALLLSVAPLPPTPLPTPADSVLAVVKQLFDGMRAGDSSVVRRVFHPNATLMTSITRNGMGVIQRSTVDDFAKSVGTPHPAVYDERLFNPKVEIDGGLASVWVEYSFWLGTTFSHCGIDAFQLARLGSEWKIIAIADTRRTDGCNKGP